MESPNLVSAQTREFPVVDLAMFVCVCVFMMEWDHCALRRWCCGVVKDGAFILIFLGGVICNMKA